MASPVTVQLPVRTWMVAYRDNVAFSQDLPFQISRIALELMWYLAAKRVLRWWVLLCLILSFIVNISLASVLERIILDLFESSLMSCELNVIGLSWFFIFQSVWTSSKQYMVYGINFIWNLKWAKSGHKNYDQLNLALFKNHDQDIVQIELCAEASGWLESLCRLLLVLGMDEIWFSLNLRHSRPYHGRQPVPA